MGAKEKKKKNGGMLKGKRRQTEGVPKTKD